MKPKKIHISSADKTSLTKNFPLCLTFAFVLDITHTHTQCMHMYFCMCVLEANYFSFNASHYIQLHLLWHNNLVYPQRSKHLSHIESALFFSQHNLNLLIMNRLYFQGHQCKRILKYLPILHCIHFMHQFLLNCHIFFRLATFSFLERVIQLLLNLD